MNRRSLLGALALTGPIIKVPRKTYGFRADSQRKLLETAEDRLNQLLALIPDTEKFRELQKSHQAWVDFKRQADAWNSPIEDTPSAYSSVMLINENFRRLGYHGYDQTLSIGRNFNQHNTDALAVWTGIEPDGLIPFLRELNFEELDFGNITVLLQRDVDIRRMFLNDVLRFIAILESHNAIVFASSVELILEYAGSMAAGVPTLKDRGDESARSLIREVAWAQHWPSARALDKSNAQFPWEYSDLPHETIETIRGLEHLEKMRFGVSPRVFSFAFGQDAGFTERNLRNPEEPPREVADGYLEPSQFITLKYESQADASLACDIIDWRWENALSWGNGEPLAETLLPQPIDRSEIGLGIITQTLDSRSSYFLHSLKSERWTDLSIYGWGSL